MMIKSKTFGYNILMAMFFMLSCSTYQVGNRNNPLTKEAQPKVGTALPPAVVYKTKNDYFDKVPVILSDDKTRVVSFPDPRDLKINGEFVYPSRLENGYLLDNRGINQNAGFLKFSYEQYCNMDNIPTADRLFDYITDSNPFTEIYKCGYRVNYQDIIGDLNALISSGKIKDCKSLLK